VQADNLSVRLVTDGNGNVTGQQGHYPFGESWYATGATTKWKFTGYERDAESANDYAMARYDVNRLGRFGTPDPLGGSPALPQSLNRYAYTQNDPINAVDPLGLCSAVFEFAYMADAGPVYAFVGLTPDCYFGSLRTPQPAVGGDTGGGGGNGSKKISDACKKALAAAGQDASAVARANADAKDIEAAAALYGVDPNILAAIGVRETGFKNVPGGGNDNNGAGIYQIDLGYHDAASIAYNPALAAYYAAGLLANSYTSYLSSGYSPEAAEVGAIRDYNASPKLTPYFLDTGYVGYADIHTTHNNYVTNVIAIAANCFNF